MDTLGWFPVWTGMDWREAAEVEVGVRGCPVLVLSSMRPLLARTVVDAHSCPCS